MRILGIETSCDETAIAVVDADRNILMNDIHSQIKLHAQYGGVIPELAARNHVEILPKMLEEAIKAKKIDLKSIDGIAVTAGPGLISGIIVGVMIAKGLASALGKPCIPINHLEGHALTARLTEPSLEFPYLLLLISGGHCQILFAKALGEYKLLGSTKDDAVGEAFDKVAKMLGLEYPGGPEVEKLSLKGDPQFYNFPKAFFRERHCNMSFSGIKTAVSRQIANEESLSDKIKSNIAASFQEAISITLCDRIENAIKNCDADKMHFSNVVVAGGVAANKHIFNRLRNLCNTYEKGIIVPPINLCTDNAAMIAWVGIEKMTSGAKSDISFAPKSKWSIASN